MKNLALIFLLILAGCALKKDKKTFFKAEIIPMRVSGIAAENPDYAKGVSAAFAGRLGDYLIVAGGCNFPHIPVAEGGKKVYYSEIFAAKLNDSNELKFKKIGELPQPLAYGASVIYKGHLLLIGGQNSSGNQSTVYDLSLATNGCLQISKRKNLAQALSNFSATLVADNVYVFAQNYQAILNLNNNVYTENFAQNGQKLQNVAISTGKENFVFSGFSLTSKQELAKVSNQVVIYNLNNHLLKNSEKTIFNNEPITFSGGNGMAISPEYFVLGNGVNLSIFEAALQRDSILSFYLNKGDKVKYDSILSVKKEYLKHSKNWYKFNPDLYLYSVTNHRLEKLATDTENLAKAGATWAVINPYEIIQINGEEKPGIRTPKMIKIKILKYEK